MNSRVFEDEQGKIWIVTKQATGIEVRGRRNNKENLHDIARRCAKKLGVTQTKSGIPLEDINEHRRIWNTIWELGHKV